MPDLGSTLALNYVVVKVDVGRFKKNLDIAGKYGIPVRKGIPAFGIIHTEGKNITIISADGRKDTLQLSPHSHATSGSAAASAGSSGRGQLDR